MLIDLNDEEPGDLAFDLCIIGGGAAGITLASELAGSGLRIGVLESGGHDYEPEIQDLYVGRNVGIPYFPLDTARLRYFGGSTNHWGGWCTPLSDIDLAKRDWVPDSGWPITHDEMASYFPRARKYCDLRGEVFAPPDAASLAPVALDPALEVMQYWQVSQPIVRFAETFGPALIAAPDVTVVLHATVTRLVTDAAGGHVEAIEATTLGGRRLTVRATRVVLACGGIENARLLLLSDQPHTGGLANSSGMVGRNFMEHPHVNIGTLTSGDAGSDWVGLRRMQGVGGEFIPGLCLSDQRQRAEQVLNGSVTLESLETSDLNGVSALRRLVVAFSRFQWPKRFDDLAWTVLTDMDRIGEEAWYRVSNLDFRGVSQQDLRSRTEQAPNPDSRLTLGDELDALGQRRSVLDWRMTPLDRRTITVNAMTVAAELTRLGLGRVRLRDWVAEAPDAWPETMTGGWHHMGMTRMSTDPAAGVVDTDCRCHDIDNLYVAGASVFPTGGYANPTFTLVTLAVRLADHLRDTGAEPGVAEPGVAGQAR